MADINLDLDSLSDDDLDKVVAQIVGEEDEGGADDGSQNGTAEGQVAGTPAEGSDSGLEGREQQEPPPAVQESPKPTGKQLLDMLGSDTEAQKLIQAQLKGWLEQASAVADAKKEQEEFEKLIASGDFEEIGRRYVTQQQEQKIRNAAAEEAAQKAYGEVYERLFTQIGEFDLTAEDKERIDPNKFDSDAEYVLALTNFIHEKRAGADIGKMVDQLVQEKLEALKNMKAAQSNTTPSPSSLPGAVEAPGNNTSSRTLISEGLREFMEASHQDRVGIV